MAKEDVSRPVTLYVQKVETNPAMLEFLESTRVSVIDIEIPILQAIQIAEYIHERNADGLNSSVRIRLSGRLIHI